ncbi:hypothetical protein AVEN_84340-1 [Araneus ventricosus]|uniref:Uncharacterized protein n=1 Tax=Araneus ventricosus TaxID=182803 RepID=A0A4Y2KA89_ARAVE|nr:hypothetical protein AVEN_84340-1 [Araneus ventricosus]
MGAELCRLYRRGAVLQIVAKFVTRTSHLHTAEAEVMAQRGQKKEERKKLKNSRIIELSRQQHNVSGEKSQRNQKNKRSKPINGASSRRKELRRKQKEQGIMIVRHGNVTRREKE